LKKEKIMTDKFRIDNKIVLISGGSKGIGLGIAKAMAKAGAEIVLVARNKANLEQAVELLSQIGCRISSYSFDMSQVEKIDELFGKIINDTGGIDILVNNAGGTRRGPAEKLSMEDWNFIINLNLTAVFKLCQVFAKERIKAGEKGKIINIASMMSETVREDNAPYAASKGGIRQLTKALAVDWAPYQINVNAIGPGFIRTDLTRRLWENEKFNKWIEWKIPAGRWGNPEDLGNAAVYLASPASDFVTGHILYVDGGLLATFGPSSW
jgi:gluconate 5-dehydrogenase